MWTRTELKSNAKMILKRTYWMSFVGCLILGFLGNGSSVSNIYTRYSNIREESKDLGFEEILGEFSPELLGILMAGLVMIMVISMVYALFVGYPMLVGRGRFFMAGREEDMELRDLFYAFTSGSYLHIVKTMFLVELYTALWSLLFVIPGIIKHYEYFFVPYLLSENPTMDTRRAFELSKEMTRGRKWNIFLLEMSFLGWYFLGTICCGIGILFVMPYYQATMAELYAASRAYVLQERITDTTELLGYAKSYNHKRVDF